MLGFSRCGLFLLIVSGLRVYFFFCVWLFFFFCLDTKEERNKKKKSRLRLRGCCGTAGSAGETKLAALRQRFALAARLVPPLDASPPRPFFLRKGAALFAGGGLVLRWLLGERNIAILRPEEFFLRTGDFFLCTEGEFLRTEIFYGRTLIWDIS